MDFFFFFFFKLKIPLLKSITLLNKKLFVYDRSPSPEPIYGTDGKRLNTREYRMRRKLEEERHAMIQKMVSLNPEFKPPVDYKYLKNSFKKFSLLNKLFYFEKKIISIFYLKNPRPPMTRVSDKVMIPQEEHPEINFVGLLIGPRGNTLKCNFIN